MAAAQPGRPGASTHEEPTRFPQTRGARRAGRFHPGLPQGGKASAGGLHGSARSAARVSLPRLGRPLPQAVDLGQSRALHALGQLHRLLLLERLRAQWRHDSRRAGRRLSAHLRRSARLQSARLPEGRLLHRIRLRAAAAALAADPRRRARRGQVAQGHLGRSAHAGRRQAARQHLPVRSRHQHLLQRDPRHEPGLLLRGLALRPLHRRRVLLLLRLVLRPAAGRAAHLGRADRSLRVRRLVQLQVHRAVGQQHLADPHPRRALRLGGALQRRQDRGHLAGLQLVDDPRRPVPADPARHRCRAGAGRGQVHRRQQSLRRAVRQGADRPAAAGGQADQPVCAPAEGRPIVFFFHDAKTRKAARSARLDGVEGKDHRAQRRRPGPALLRWRSDHRLRADEAEAGAVHAGIGGADHRSRAQRHPAVRARIRHAQAGHDHPRRGAQSLVPQRPDQPRADPAGGAHRQHRQERRRLQPLRGAGAHLAGARLQGVRLSRRRRRSSACRT